MNRVLVERIASIISSETDLSWLTSIRKAEAIEFLITPEDMIQSSRSFFNVCRGFWPNIRPKEADLLSLLLSREYVSYESAINRTETTSERTIHVWISRLRKFTQVSITNHKGEGYHIAPEARKSLKEKLNGL